MGGLAQTLLEWLTNLGYFGIAIGLMIEIIPSELVLAYAGYLVSKGEVSFVGAIIAGTIGGTIAQLFLYWIGAYGGRPFLLKYGKYLFIHEKHVNVADNWFKKYGSGVIFTARFIPVVRHAISIPAGITKMSLTKFLGYTVLAIVPWSILFTYLGFKLSDHWTEFHQYSRQYVIPAAIVAVILIAVYLIYSHFSNKKKVN